jgi:hypothetical protein
MVSMLTFCLFPRSGGALRRSVGLSPIRLCLAELLASLYIGAGERPSLAGRLQELSENRVTGSKGVLAYRRQLILGFGDLSNEFLAESALFRN